MTSPSTSSPSPARPPSPPSPSASSAKGLSKSTARRARRSASTPPPTRTRALSSPSRTPRATRSSSCPTTSADATASSPRSACSPSPSRAWTPTPCSPARGRWRRSARSADYDQPRVAVRRRAPRAVPAPARRSSCSPAIEPSFRFMAEWWKQLYGESEGKEGKGLFPASVDFTADLHSMGQYIQQGERTLLETVVRFARRSRPVHHPARPRRTCDGLNFLSGQDAGLRQPAGHATARSSPTSTAACPTSSSAAGERRCPHRSAS